MDPALLATAALALASAPRGTIPTSLGELGALVRGGVEADPMRATLTTVLVATALFYRAEHGVNPKVRRWEDALVFCTTCLSVGYADIFARTPTGKAVASFLMTFGPALSAKILDAPAPRR